MDTKLNFSGRIKSNTQKIGKTMGLLRQFQEIFPRLSFLTVYKNFIRSWFDYTDFIYDQAYTSVFHDKFESTQYNAC